LLRKICWVLERPARGSEPPVDDAAVEEVAVAVWVPVTWCMVLLLEFFWFQAGGAADTAEEKAKTAAAVAAEKYIVRRIRKFCRLGDYSKSDREISNALEESNERTRLKEIRKKEKKKEKEKIENCLMVFVA
jgi:hypothetical protein